MSPLIHNLVAHRGYPLHYPENTLEGLRAAVDTGARWIEFDVQLSNDGVPIVIHDVSLRRTAGIETDVMELDLTRIKAIEVNEGRRLGGAFHGIHIPTLDEVCAFLERVPRVTALVEIKPQSLDRFGIDAVIQPVMEALRPVLHRCILISFDVEAIKLARALGAPRIGWVLRCWTDEFLATAESLAPDYLVCSYKLLPNTGALWPGPWRWMVYQTCDPKLAIALHRRGVELIETDAIGEMQASLRGL